MRLLAIVLCVAFVTNRWAREVESESFLDIPIKDAANDSDAQSTSIEDEAKGMSKSQPEQKEIDQGGIAGSVYSHTIDRKRLKGGAHNVINNNVGRYFRRWGMRSESERVERVRDLTSRSSSANEFDVLIQSLQKFRKTMKLKSTALAVRLGKLSGKMLFYLRSERNKSIDSGLLALSQRLVWLLNSDRIHLSSSTGRSVNPDVLELIKTIEKTLKAFKSKQDNKRKQKTYRRGFTSRSLTERVKTSPSSAV